MNARIVEKSHDKLPMVAQSHFAHGKFSDRGDLGISLASSSPPFERFICPSQCVGQNSVHETNGVVHCVRFFLRPLTTANCKILDQ